MSPRQEEEGGAGGAGREEAMMERRDQRLGNCVEQSVGIACCAKEGEGARARDLRGGVAWSGVREGEEPRRGAHVVLVELEKRARTEEDEAPRRGDGVRPGCAGRWPLESVDARARRGAAHAPREGGRCANGSHQAMAKCVAVLFRPGPDTRGGQGGRPAGTRIYFCKVGSRLRPCNII